MPDRLRRIDVTNADDAGLIEQKFFQRAARGGDRFCEATRRKILGETVDTEILECGAGFGGFVSVDTTEMAVIGEAEDALVEFDVDAYSFDGLIGPP